MGKDDIRVYSPKALGWGHKLSANITLGEMLSKGKDGSEPTPVDMELIEKIQKMRDLLGEPVHINSGYRTAKHNAEVGGTTGSYHTLGRAADIWFGATDIWINPTSGKRIPDRMAAQCAQYVGFKGIGLYPNRIHVDTRQTPYYYEKPGNAYIPVPGFPGYRPPEGTTPDVPNETGPADTVPVLIKCRCGASLPAIEGLRVNGTVYTPVRAVCEALGYEVKWDGKQVTVE